MTVAALSTAVPYFSAPYHTGGASSSLLVPKTFPVSIDGHPYMVDWTQYQRQHLEAQRPAFDNQAEPGETSLNPMAFWRRSQSRFDLGAGQAFFDDEQSDVFPTRRFASTRQRYFASKGLDPWQDNGIGLLPATEQLTTSAATNLKMLTVGKYLYITAGAVLTVIDTSGGSPGSDTGPANITSITTDGAYVYVTYGTGNNVDKVTVGDMTPNLTGFGTLEPDLIRYSNGRMIAVRAGALWEYDSAGAEVGSALVDPDFGGTWADVVGTPVGIFAAINVGDYRGELYVVDVDTDTGGLNPGRFAARLNNGETFNCLFFYGTLIIAGTNFGYRVFTLTGQGGQIAEQQPLVEIPGGVTAFAGVGKYVYFSWSNYDSTSTGIGRMDASKSLDPDAIIPPYASDLMAGVTGAVVQGTVTSIAIVAPQDNRVVFAVSGVGFYAADDSDVLVASGTFDSGWVRFGSLFEKSYSGVELGHDALAGSIDVALLTSDAPTPSSIGSSTSEGSTFSEVFGTSIRARAVRVQLTLHRDAVATTTGPLLRWWTLLGYPAPPRAQEIILPIILRDKVSPHVGPDVNVDVLSEKEHLDRLARSGEIVGYREFDLAENVVVTQVIFDADKNREKPNQQQSNTRRWLQGTAIVRMLTKEN